MARKTLLYEICGPLVYQVHIDELEGRTLAPYRVQTVEIELTTAELEEYQKFRNIFLNFIRKERIRFDEPNGWQNFLFKSSRSIDGREAFQAYLAQKKLSQASGTKLQKIWQLLAQHIEDRVILFTQDNEMAYKIGREFLLPVLTHHTKSTERDQLLKKFRGRDLSDFSDFEGVERGCRCPRSQCGRSWFQGAVVQGNMFRD